jgi:hypothetical protein
VLGADRGMVGDDGAFPRGGFLAVERYDVGHLR